MHVHVSIHINHVGVKRTVAAYTSFQLLIKCTHTDSITEYSKCTWTCTCTSTHNKLERTINFVYTRIYTHTVHFIWSLVTACSHAYTLHPITKWSINFVWEATYIAEEEGCVHYGVNLWWGGGPSVSVYYWEKVEYAEDEREGHWYTCLWSFVGRKGILWFTRLAPVLVQQLNSDSVARGNNNTAPVLVVYVHE
jgi:hypothetical protein